jgi:hypothetical protein
MNLYKNEHIKIKNCTSNTIEQIIMNQTENRLNLMEMEKITPKKIVLNLTRFSAFIFAFLFIIGNANAQGTTCPLACNKRVQLSMDDDCRVTVTPDMMLEGQGVGSCNYTVTVMGTNGLPLTGSPIITSSSVGQVLTVKVNLGLNSCWGEINVEDKLAPIITCPKNDTLSCYDKRAFANPSATDNCGGTVVVRLLSNELEDNACNSAFTAVRTLSYQAEDALGNKSPICQKLVYYKKINIDSLVFAPNRDGVEAPVLTCDSTRFWDKNNNGYPDPEEAGIPTIDGSPVFPNNSICELNATFTDQRINICGVSFKVLRKWTVLDWCSGKLREDYQVIKVSDIDGPIITCPLDRVSPLNPAVRVADIITSDPFTCSAKWVVPAPIVAFECSKTTFTVDYLLADNNGRPPVNGVYINDNVKKVGSTYEISGLPVGQSWIRYTVTDECGNFTYCFTEVVVVDNVPPTAVCDEFTVATLTNASNGIAQINASTFDDGSHDNCTAVKLDARRMTAGCGESLVNWTDKLTFCCEDVGKDVMVSLRVTDANNNSNTCMVTVRIQDKIAPTISCPANITLNCDQDITNLNITGRATAFDNCSTNTPTFSDAGTLNQCNIGTIRRTWSVKDNNPTSSPVTCVQTITVVNNSPFVESNINWSQITSRTLEGCSAYDTDPSNTGRPTWTSDNCDLIASTHEDQVFNIVDSACLKIIRTWTVIDWCTFNQLRPNDGGRYSRTQIIKIANTRGPVFTTCPRDTTIDAFGANCDAFVNFRKSATDDCTPQKDLVWKYSLDANNNGSIDVTGNANNFSGTYPVGNHKLVWTSEDKCGNKSTCTTLVSIKDAKKPTPYCLGEITTVIMPSSGNIDIWASDYDKGSFDNCPGKLKFSFTTDTNDIRRIFTCANVGMNNLNMYVTDFAGNKDFCIVKINIQANPGSCGNLVNENKVQGQVITHGSVKMHDVTMKLEGPESMIAKSDANGTFTFETAKSNTNYTLNGTSNGEYLNGINTLDLVLMQRHILNLNKLSTPENIIAADVNNDSKISISDLVDLRKLILGVYDKLPKSTSWKFINGNKSFADPSKPFDFEESIIINVEKSNINDIKINGIKMGDVNQSAAVNAKDLNAEPRSNKTLGLSIGKQDFQAGNRISIPVIANGNSQIVGLQLALNSTKDLKIVGIVPGKLNIQEGEYRITDAGILTSFASEKKIEISNNDELFTLVVEATNKGEVSKSITVGTDKFQTEAYSAELEKMKVSLTSRGSEISDFSLGQNIPNPFQSSTTIEFTLPEAQRATLNIYDITGKTVFSKTSSFNKGSNQIVLESTQLGNGGILYYQLESNGFVSTKKMIMINK